MNSDRLYYFDNNATTRVAPEVLEAMLPFLKEDWGNPSSAYSFGRRAAKEIERAREQVADLINADPREIVFTSCGTESNNTAIQSALLSEPSRRHLVTTTVEHSSNINFAQTLQRRGFAVSFLPVEPDGTLDLHLLERSIRPDTALVSVMWGNNETGVMFPIEEVAAICRSRGVRCHSDAVQMPGKVRIDVAELGVDFLSLSAHKLYAPKGIGLLYVRRRTRFEPYIIGGHQDNGRRGGTENVPYIVGFGRAAELAAGQIADENTRVRKMRDRLEREILERIAAASGNGAREPRLPNTSSMCFEGIEGEAMVLALDQFGICVSTGSACTTGSPAPSHVLTAMGIPPERARGSIRFSLGIYNSPDEIDYLLAHLPGVVEELRKASPWQPKFKHEPRHQTTP